MALLGPVQSHVICVLPFGSHLNDSHLTVSWFEWEVCVCIGYPPIHAVCSPCPAQGPKSSLQYCQSPVLKGPGRETRAGPQRTRQIEGLDPSPNTCTCCSQTQPPGCTLRPASPHCRWHAPSCKAAGWSSVTPEAGREATGQRTPHSLS